MKLHIDTRENSKTIVGLDKERLEQPTGPDKSQQVLGLINQILNKNKKTLKDLTAIEVETGPGSFTGLRVGLAVANALGWALKIPVNNKKVGELVEPKYK
jgi:tRNA threonylcarbamoyl adenosine modification protein YeaZ